MGNCRENSNPQDRQRHKKVLGYFKFLANLVDGLAMDECFLCALLKSLPSSSREDNWPIIELTIIPCVKPNEFVFCGGNISFHYIFQVC